MNSVKRVKFKMILKRCFSHMNEKRSKVLIEIFCLHLFTRICNVKLCMNLRAYISLNFPFFNEFSSDEVEQVLHLIKYRYHYY